MVSQGPGATKIRPVPASTLRALEPRQARYPESHARSDHRNRPRHRRRPQAGSGAAEMGEARLHDNPAGPAQGLGHGELLHHVRDRLCRAARHRRSGEIHQQAGPVSQAPRRAHGPGLFGGRGGGGQRGPRSRRDRLQGPCRPVAPARTSRGRGRTGLQAGLPQRGHAGRIVLRLPASDPRSGLAAGMDGPPQRRHRHRLDDRRGEEHRRGPGRLEEDFWAGMP